MPLKNTLEAKMTYRIKRNKSSVFIRKDFADLSGTDQIGRVLRKLVKEQVLIKIGYGAYARATKSIINDEMILEKPLQELTFDLLKKLGIKARLSKAFDDYNSGRSTQIPTGRRIEIEGRFNRTIEYNGTRIYFRQSS